MDYETAIGNLDLEILGVKPLVLKHIWYASIVFISIGAWVVKKIIHNIFKPVNNVRWALCDKKKCVWWNKAYLCVLRICVILVSFLMIIYYYPLMLVDINNVLLNIFNQINFYSKNSWNRGTTAPWASWVKQSSHGEASFLGLVGWNHPIQPGGGNAEYELRHSYSCETQKGANKGDGHPDTRNSGKHRHPHGEETIGGNARA